MHLNRKEKAEWFEDWFDSPYYHILYKNRNENEAEGFISNLIDFLKPSEDKVLLDVACGKGRHSVYLNTLGYNVHGFDLSKNSIKFAQKSESDRLKFFVNDIRTSLNINHYDYAFNLFTSFGYFNDEKDNELAIKSIAQSLTKKGILILDFMNCHKVIQSIDKGLSETKLLSDIEFRIKKQVKNGFILKDISFIHEKKEFYFQEKVKSISLEDFTSYFENANLKIENIFGDYNLNKFNLNTSDRLILIAKKNE